MQFDVIIGNPPYQLASDGGTRDIPIYNKFVEQAKKLEPRYLLMVIPSRWMAAGLGLGDFRAEMLADQRIRKLVDFPDSSDVFPGVKLMGGACYFLWDRDNPGLCETTLVRAGETLATANRRLDEFDVLVRDSRALAILRKVRDRQEPSIIDVLSADKEFGLTSNFDDYKDAPFPSAIPLYAYQGAQRIVGWIARNKITKSRDLIDTWKVLICRFKFSNCAIDRCDCRREFNLDCHRNQCQRDSTPVFRATQLHSAPFLFDQSHANSTPHQRSSKRERSERALFTVSASATD
jgi:site-specific DNA-methyltransferase (adenine-specific)